jgi:type I restriction enzyme S subunit
MFNKPIKTFKISEVMEIYDERTKETNKHQILSSTNSGLHLQEEYFKRQIASLDNTGYKVIKKNMVVLSPQNAWLGNINYNYRYDIGIVSPSYIVLAIKENFVKEYISQLLKTYQFTQIIKNASETGASIVRKSFNVNQFFESKLRIHDFQEQKKIGLFLSAIDRIVEKYNNKAKALRKAKDSFIISYIKSKNDEIIEYSIKDIFEITRGYVLAISNMSNIKDEKNPYPVYSSQTLNQGLAGYYKEYLYEDAITWTTDGANAGDVNFRKGKFYCTNVCGVLLSKKGFSNNYVAYLLSSVAKKYVSYVGNPKLMNGTMGEIKIKIPSIQEQVRIGNFISHLDSLIQQQEQYIAKFKMLKKYYLDLLFTIKEKM